VASEAAERGEIRRAWLTDTLRGNHETSRGTYGSRSIRAKLADAYDQRINKKRLALSIGTVGDAFDNAVVESFWGRMQTELSNRKRWTTRVDCRRRSSTG